MSDLANRLTAWESTWQRLGVEISSVLRPGIARDDARRLILEATNSIHRDVIEWFAWHDGVKSGSHFAAAPLMTPLLSLREALEERHIQLEQNEDVPDDLPDRHRFATSWLPLTGDTGSGAIALDLKSGAVLDVNWWGGGDGLTTVRSDSLVEAVSLSIHALDSGWYIWRSGTWESDFAAIPVEYRGRGFLR